MASEVQKLEIFVKEALQRGSARPEIEKALTAAGWPAVQIKSALSGFADGGFPIPVPKPRPSLSARDAFLYLVMFATLYYSAINLVTLLFDFVDRAYPDPGDRMGIFWHETTGHWPTAAIICAFPIYLFIANFINKEIRANPAKKLSPIRRWLTYLTLFVTICILIGDATTLVYNVLNGDLTIRFILKVIIAAAVAGTIFLYYFCDLKKEEKE